MVLLEEFNDKVRPDIRSHLDEQKVEKLEKVAVMADDYALTHKISSKYSNPQQKRKGTMVQVIEKIYPEIQMIERDKVSLLKMWVWSVR